MNTLVAPVESYLNDTISVVRIDGPYQDHDELIAAVDEADIRFSDLFPSTTEGNPDPLLSLHPTIRHPQGAKALRDLVCSEYIPHLDGTTIPIRPSATLVVGRDIGPNPPPTRFIDPVGFLELARSNDIFRNFDPEQVNSIFGYSAYFDQAQRLFDKARPRSKRMKEVKESDLARYGGTNVDEMIDILDANPLTGPRPYPLVSPHSVTGQPAIMMDAGVRHMGFDSRPEGPEIDEKELEVALKWLRLLLADTVRLDAEGITETVAPRTGFGVVFPKESIHHAVATVQRKRARVARDVTVIGLIDRQLVVSS